MKIKDVNRLSDAELHKLYLQTYIIQKIEGKKINKPKIAYALGLEIEKRKLRNDKIKYGIY